LEDAEEGSAQPDDHEEEEPPPDDEEELVVDDVQRQNADGVDGLLAAARTIPSVRGHSNCLKSLLKLRYL